MHCDERQQIVLAAGRAGHSFEELPSVEDSDAVKEHDQAGKADRPGDLRLRGERADGEADEQDGSDTERESAKIDLADQIADADGEEYCKDRLRPDDFAGKIEHDDIPRLDVSPGLAEGRSAGAAARGTELFEHATRSSSGVGARRVGVLVVELHRLPFERAELMERLHLDPLDILHRRDEPGDLLDIGGIVGEARHQREAHPHGLADRGEPLGEAQRRRQVAAGRPCDRFPDPRS